MLSLSDSSSLEREYCNDESGIEGILGALVFLYLDLGVILCEISINSGSALKLRSSVSE